MAFVKSTINTVTKHITLQKKKDVLRPSLEKKHQVCEIPVYLDLSGINALTITIYQLIIKYCIICTVNLRITKEK